MKMLTSRFLTAVTVICGIAVPAKAQAPYPLQQPQSQPWPDQPKNSHDLQPFYGKPAYGFDHASLSKFMRQLLGSRYSEVDRMSVEKCAIAAMQQAAVQYQPQPSHDSHPYGQGYNSAALMRITAITEVQRRQFGLQVSGLIDGRFGHAPYGHPHGYQNNGYLSAGELRFRCDIDDHGIVSNLRVHSANTYRG